MKKAEFPLISSLSFFWFRNPNPLNRKLTLSRNNHPQITVLGIDKPYLDMFKLEMLSQSSPIYVP
jgi:hypothetical protein